MEPKSIFHSHSIPTGAFTYIFLGRDLRSVEDEDEETFQYCKSEGRMRVVGSDLDWNGRIFGDKYEFYDRKSVNYYSLKQLSWAAFGLEQKWRMRKDFQTIKFSI